LPLYRPAAVPPISKSAKAPSPHVPKHIVKKYGTGPGQPEQKSFQSVNAQNMVDLFSGDFSYNIPLANGDYALHRWRVEGYRVARLGWGASGAQPLAYAFQFYSTAAGTAFLSSGTGSPNSAR